MVKRSARSTVKPAPSWPKKILLFFIHLGPLNFFWLAAIATGFWAHHLQGVAFPQAGSSGQPISVTVYVKNLPAQVSLKSTFTPGGTANLTINSVTVTGPSKKTDPWLLVVQGTPCKALSGKPRPESVQFWSESVSGSQLTGNVVAVAGPAKLPITFACSTGLAEQGQTVAQVIQGRDLNLSLPVLEQNPDSNSDVPNAPVYIESVAGKIKDLVEVQAVPGAPCPAVTAAPQPTGTASPTDSGSATSSPSAPATASPTASGGNAAACYAQHVPGATSVRYSFPAMVGTTEMLAGVNLSNDRIDSMYPTGGIATNLITWKGVAGLDPSLSATNLNSAAEQNKDAFWAGLLWGLAGGFAIPFVQECFDAWRNRTKDPPAAEPDSGAHVEASSR
jgi:hypothetical protein